MNIAEAILTKNLSKHASKPAVGFKKKETWKELSWKKLADLVGKTANAMLENGIAADDKVAVYADNSAEWIIFDLAALSIGAVTVPVYATSNAEQTAYVLKDSEAKIVLVSTQTQYDICYSFTQTQNSLQKIIVSKKAVWIKKENTFYLEDFIEKASPEIRIVEKSPQDLATIIYSSGTTGTPKGIMLKHENFLKAFDAHFEYFTFKNFENEISLAFLPLTHVFERCWTLLCLYGGARVFFLENTKDIANALMEVRPTMMCTVPRFLQKIYAGVQEKAEESSSAKKKIFAWAFAVGQEAAEIRRKNENVPLALNLKNKVADALVFSKIKEKMGGRLWFIPCGGASVSENVTEFFEAAGIHITVGYGLTETTATLTAFPLKNFVHGSCGKPLPGIEVKIGENDEIWAKGNGIMLGFYKKEEETKKVFTEDGWFKTGDAGRLDEAGNLYITDRIKDLMKTSNGKYIAPQQIENILTNNNYIQQIVLIADGRQFVSALIVPNFEFLQNHLSQKKIPHENWETAVKQKEVTDLYKNILKDLQKDLSDYEKVKKFTLMPAEFDIQNGEITPTLKIKRAAVLKKYENLIEEMYQ